VRNPGLGDQQVVVSNLSTIEQVKEAYLAAVGPAKCAEKGAEVSKVRFFCLGKELKLRSYYRFLGTLTEIISQRLES